MRKKIIEHDKKREINNEQGGYVYQETIVYPEEDDAVEFITMCKESDYSFYYFNGAESESKGKFTIESDSIFYDAFNRLIGEELEFKIDDDYSEKNIIFKRNEDGDIEVLVHLLPGENDGTIELKNIMFDLRSSSDAEGKDTKKRLSEFFDELMALGELIPDEKSEQHTLNLTN